MPAHFLSDPGELARAPEIVVVGGGVAGLASAFFLSQAGLRPLVIERLPALAMLASRRSGEGVRAQWETPSMIAAARASIGLYAGFAELTGRPSGYRPIGYLYGSRTAAGAARLKARVARQQAAGLGDVAFLDGEAARRLVPTLAPGTTGAAFRAGDGVVDIAEIVAGYLQAMEADILTGTDLLHLRARPDGVSLTTTKGAIDAGRAVLATATRTTGLLASLGAALPLRLARSTIQYVELPGVPAEHPAVVDADLGSFWRPDRGGARMTASFRSTLFLDRFTDDPQADPDYLAHAIASVAPLVPFWGERASGIAGGHLRSGSLLVTGDGAPVIGALPGQPAVLLNTGYGGHGIMMSPEGARMLAAEAAGGPPGPFSPSRFAEGPGLPPEPMTVNLATDQGQTQ
ncbi:FAD-binding oxidoreductase [Poseidonocella sp. HB161398]|uniref:NAD(P)/FAD-dependent oxidoreductase n=1 Tax=Poseidonocella sp. HB161398 TaxID=2320855 RepID=UPI001108A26F|nr:FAD-binding oxidoreductase [Poseidonocella sp. HB161398]